MTKTLVPLGKHPQVDNKSRQLWDAMGTEHFDALLSTIIAPSYAIYIPKRVGTNIDGEPRPMAVGAALRDDGRIGMLVNSQQDGRELLYGRLVVTTSEGTSTLSPSASDKKIRLHGANLGFASCNALANGATTMAVNTAKLKFETSSQEAWGRNGAGRNLGEGLALNMADTFIEGNAGEDLTLTNNEFDAGCCTIIANVLYEEV